MSRSSYSLLIALLACTATAALGQTTPSAPPSASIDPAVATSSDAEKHAPGAASSTPAADKDAPPAQSAAAAGVAAAPKAATAAAGKAAAAASDTGPKRSGAGANAVDRLDLGSTEISGNRELPKVLYVVPWRRPELGDAVGRPPNSLVDEVLAPVDRDVFQRQNRYYDALQAGAASGKSQPGTANAPAPAAPPKDER
jgi:hypothetical protein